MSLEENAIDLVGEIINNSKLPIEKAKHISLTWDDVDGYILPVFNYSFYETVEEKENANT